MNKLASNEHSAEVKVPVDLRWKDDQLFVVLFTMKRTHFRDPFFIDSLAKVYDILHSQIKLPEENEPLARPIFYDENSPYVTLVPISQFIREYNVAVKEKRLNFIFHMSRCGSTLASQMLATCDRFFVLSEPIIINAVLDPALNVSVDERKKLFSACINALVSIAPESSEEVFVKFRSWNIFYLDLIISEFPLVRWIYIHRNGVEVLSSVLAKPPGWLRSRISYAKYFAELLSVKSELIRQMTMDEFVARILGVFCRTALAHKSDRSCFLEYTYLKKDFINILSSHNNIVVSKDEKKRMIEASEIYSKDTKKEKTFVPDSDAKRLSATQDQVELVNRFVESERVRLINN